MLFNLNEEAGVSTTEEPTLEMRKPCPLPMETLSLPLYC